MQIETIEAVGQPFLHTTRTSGTKPAEISAVMGDALREIGAFIGQAGITPVGPPMAIYRTWEAAETTFEVGFPVALEDADKEAGSIETGVTPEGRALKAIHTGAYADLSRTYEVLQEEAAKAGIPQPRIAWEIYMNDPGSVPEDELVTEVYLLLD